MKKAIPILLIIGLIALALQIFEIVASFLLILVGIICLLIAIILWLVKLVA